MPTKTPYTLPKPKAQTAAKKSADKAKDPAKELLKRKIDAIMSSYGRRIQSNVIQSASEQLKHYIDSGQIKQFHFTHGQDSHLNTLLTAGLMTIAINNGDNKAKKIVEDSLIPSKNPIFMDRIIRSYNQSKQAEFPIKKLTNEVIKIVDESFHYSFNDAWTTWIKDNLRENKILLGGFIGDIDSRVTAKQGSFKGSGFPHRWNTYNKSPEKFKQQPAGPEQIDKSKHTISDIVNYIYSYSKKNNDFTRVDAFNKANQEIYKYLLMNSKNPLIAKVFDGVVGSKLDYEELAGTDKGFKNDPQYVKSVFSNLQKNKAFVDVVNNTYKKFGLNLPNFITWKASDLNKGPSDRGELTADKPEIGRDDKGNLAKIKYNQYGDKTYSKLQELRSIIRETLENNFKQPNNGSSIN